MKGEEIILDEHRKLRVEIKIMKKLK